MASFTDSIEHRSWENKVEGRDWTAHLFDGQSSLCAVDDIGWRLVLALAGEGGGAIRLLHPPSLPPVFLLLDCKMDKSPSRQKMFISLPWGWGTDRSPLAVPIGDQWDWESVFIFAARPNSCLAVIITALVKGNAELIDFWAGG